MNDEMVPRVLTLTALALVGIGIGWAGTAAGLGGQITDTGSAPAFVVSGNDVTFSDSEREITVLEDFSEEQRIEITERDGGLRIETESTNPLTEAERERALEIARGNETVQRRLAEMDAYELSVEPIKGVPEDAMNRVSLNVSAEDVTAVDESDGRFRVDLEENATVEASEDSVTISPGDQTYVEDDVYVEIRDPDTNEVRYKTQVNLPEERVVIVSDE